MESATIRVQIEASNKNLKIAYQEATVVALTPIIALIATIIVSLIDMFVKGQEMVTIEEKKP